MKPINVTFLNDPVLRVEDNKTFTLEVPFRVVIEYDNGSTLDIIIPYGFETDLDSIPRIPFIYSMFKGRAIKSAILHDWLVRRGIMNRKRADEIFWLASIKADGVSRFKAFFLWLGVRIGAYLGIGRKLPEETKTRPNGELE